MSIETAAAAATNSGLEIFGNGLIYLAKTQVQIFNAIATQLMPTIDALIYMGVALMIYRWGVKQHD